MDCLNIKNLFYRYPTSSENVLKNINLTVHEGEFVALIGRNGAGKTSLCNVIRGFAPHYYQGTIKGEVYLNGKNVLESDIGELSLDAGYVFQNPFTQNSGTKYTVFEEIAFGLENLCIPRDEIIQKVKNIISLFGMESIQFNAPSELSGGQFQRVALSSVIVMNPKVLIFDEPTSQLDPEGTRQVFEIIKKLKEERRTIILVEHKMNLIAEFADRIVLMDDGQIIMDGPTRDVLTSKELQKYNTAIPQYVALGQAIQEKGFDIIPPTILTEAKEVVASVLKESLTT